MMDCYEKMYEIARKRQEFMDDFFGIRTKIRQDTLAHVLAMFNPEWITDDKEILKLQNTDGDSVAHYLAKRNAEWRRYADNPEAFKNFLAEHPEKKWWS